MLTTPPEQDTSTAPLLQQDLEAGAATPLTSPVTSYHSTADTHIPLPATPSVNSTTAHTDSDDTDTYKDPLSPHVRSAVVVATLASCAVVWQNVVNAFGEPDDASQYAQCALSAGLASAATNTCIWLIEKAVTTRALGIEAISADKFYPQLLKKFLCNTVIDSIWQPSADVGPAILQTLGLDTKISNMGASLFGLFAGHYATNELVGQFDQSAIPAKTDSVAQTFFGSEKYVPLPGSGAGHRGPWWGALFAGAGALIAEGSSSLSSWCCGNKGPSQ